MPAPTWTPSKRRVAADPTIKGIWCVPKYSNPTGCVYSDAVVARIAQLPKRACRAFPRDVGQRVRGARPRTTEPASSRASRRWQSRPAPTTTSCSSRRRRRSRSPAQASRSSRASPSVVKALEKYMSTMTIGPDKVNQLRHVRLLDGRVAQHMQQHAALIRPKFARGAGAARSVARRARRCDVDASQGRLLHFARHAARYCQTRDCACARHRRDVDAGGRHIPLRSRSRTTPTSASRRPFHVSQTSRRPPMYSYSAWNSRASSRYSRGVSPHDHPEHPS